MSYSVCIKCKSIVGGYEKYCSVCIETYGLLQDKNWHKTSHLDSTIKGVIQRDLNMANATTASPPALGLRQQYSSLNRAERRRLHALDRRRARKLIND